MKLVFDRWHWFRKLFRWAFPPSLDGLVAIASEVGRMTLQQIEGADRPYWQCSLRALGRQRYCWTGTGDTIGEAIAEALENCDNYKIGARPLVTHAPKLGGKEFDE